MKERRKEYKLVLLLLEKICDFFFIFSEYFVNIYVTNKNHDYLKACKFFYCKKLRKYFSLFKYIIIIHNDLALSVIFACRNWKLFSQQMSLYKPYSIFENFCHFSNHDELVESKCSFSWSSSSSPSSSAQLSSSTGSFLLQNSL